MSTASIVETNGFGHTNGQMRSLLVDRAAVSAAFDKLVATPRAGWDYVTAAAESTGLSRALRYLKGKASWVLGLARTAGPGNLAVLTLTTPQGNVILDRVLRHVVKVAGFVGRLALAPFAFLTRHTGNAGRKVATVATAGFCLTRDKVAAGYRDAACWLADRHDHPLTEMIRSWATWSIITRLARRFVPNGWARFGIYLVALFMVPSTEGMLTGSADLVQGAIADAQRRRQGAADAPASVDAPEPATATSAPQTTQPDGAIDAWSGLNGYLPVAKPVEIRVRRAGNVVEVVRVHRQPDGVSVFAFGKALYVGKLPDDVDETKVAEAITAAEAAPASGAAPTNRGGRRAFDRSKRRP